MGPGGEDGGDQSLGVGADAGAPAAEAVGRPFGIAAMGTGHVIGIGAVAPAAVAALMAGDTSAAMEDLDDAGRGAQVDLLADQRVGDGIEVAVELDVIVD